MKSSNSSGSSLNLSTSSKKDNVKVSVRLRPLQDIERKFAVNKAVECKKKGELGVIQCNANEYCYDQVFDEDSNNEQVFRSAVSSVVSTFMEGYNAVVFAYGQTNSGKTFTMTGTQNNAGVIPLSVHQIFKHIEESKDQLEFLIRISFMEIYNENIIDLLSPDSKDLKIHETPQKRVYVSNLKEEIITSYEQVFELIRIGEQNRHVFSTDYNAHSSRSHSILQITIESSAVGSGLSTPRTPGKKSVTNKKTKISTLSLIDLAGSEKASSSADRRREGAYINKSLLTLGTVISKLTTPGPKDQHIPYRDSKLTRILQPALSGNSIISVICTVSPSQLNVDESSNTLKFAQRIKQVKTDVSKNEIIDDKTLLQQYRNEIDELKQRLNQMSEKEIESQELVKEKKRLEDELQQQQLVRTALKERIDHLTRLILTSSSLQNEQRNSKRVSYIENPDFEVKKVIEDKDETIKRQADEIKKLKEMLNSNNDFKSELNDEKQKNEQLNSELENIRNRASVMSMRSDQFINLNDLSGMALTKEPVMLDPDQFIEMKHMVDQYKEKSEDLETENKRLKNLVGNMSKAADGQVNKLADLESENKRLQSLVENLTMKLDEVSNHSPSSKLRELESENKRLEELVKTLSTKLEEKPERKESSNKSDVLSSPGIYSYYSNNLPSPLAEPKSVEENQPPFTPVKHLPPQTALPTPPLAKTETLLKELEFNLNKEKRLRSKTIDRLATLETELTIVKTEMSVRSSMEELDHVISQSRRESELQRFDANTIYSGSRKNSLPISPTSKRSSTSSGKSSRKNSLEKSRKGELFNT